MPGFLISRRAMLEAGAAALLAAGVPAHVLAEAAQQPTGDALGRTLAAWALVWPEAGADIALAYLDSAGRVLSELPAVRLDADSLAGSKSAWAQAQDAATKAQSLAAGMLALAWGVPASECEIQPGRIVHPPTGRAMRHLVWVEVA